MGKLVIRNGLSILGTLGSGAGDPQLTIDSLTKDIGQVPATDLSVYLSTTLADGKILIGNAINIATAVTTSGNIALSNTGVFTINSGVILNAHINGLAGITRTKLASGTANAIVYNNGSGVMSEIAPGTNGYVLRMVAGVPTWSLAGPATTFTQLSDVPASYVGQTLKGVRVNVAETGLEFYTTSSGHIIKNAGTPLTARANLNFLNGLTASDNSPDTDVKLGGALTENTTIQLNSKVFNFYGNGGEFKVGDATNLSGNDPANIILSATDYATMLVNYNSYTGAAGIVAQAGLTTGYISVQQQINSGANDVALVFDIEDYLSVYAGAYFRDTRAVTKGLEYLSDYSSGYTTRSLVDKGYVTSLTGTTGAWKLASGGILTGANTITSNVANQLTFNGTWTATANNQYHANFGGALTTRNTASDEIYGYVFNPTINRNGGGPASQRAAALYVNSTIDTNIPNRYGIASVTSSSSTYNGLRIMNTSTGSAFFDMVSLNGATLGTASQFYFERKNSANGDIDIANSGTGSMVFKPGSATALSLSYLGNSTFTQSAQSSAWGSSITSIPGAHTALTTATEFISRDFQGATWTWLSGTVATQRFNYFNGYIVAGASPTATFSDIYTVYIDPPTAGTNAAITRGWAIGTGTDGNIAVGTKSGRIQLKDVIVDTAPAIVFPSNSSGFGLNSGGGIFVLLSNAANGLLIVDSSVGAGTPAAARLHVKQGALSSSWISSLRIDPGAHTGLTSATEFISNDFRGATQTWIDGTVATQRFNYFKGYTVNKTTTTATFTDIYNLYVENSTAGSGVTFTNNWAAGFNGNILVAGANRKIEIGASGQGIREESGVGLRIGSLRGGGGYCVKFVDNNDLVVYAYFFGGSGGIVPSFAFGSSTLTNATLYLLQPALSSAWKPAMRIDPGAHTSITNTLENINNDFSAVTQTWAGGGTVALQRGTIFRSQTLAGASAQTFTSASTVYILPPIAGTNASVTNAYGLYIDTANVGAGTTNAFGLLVTAPTGASSNFTATFQGGITVFAGALAGYASLRIPHGTTPSSPANGDFWSTTNGPFMRINGSTGQVLLGDLTQTLSGTTIIETGENDIHIGADGTHWFESTSGVVSINTDFNTFVLSDGDGGGAVYTDGNTSKLGIRYSASGYVTDARSLTDKGYVDSHTDMTANVVSPTSPNRTLTIVVNGTTYYIHAKTTND